MISEKIDKVIREIPDFPKKGINFKDITPLLLHADLTNDIIDSFVERLAGVAIDAIVGIESRGFLFGFLLANRMKLPFIPIRKSGKLPGDTIEKSYNLEYGNAKIEIHKTDIRKNWNILIHDDLLATGGTACASAELIKMLNAKIAGFAFVINLSFLDGENRLLQYSDNIFSLKSY